MDTGDDSTFEDERLSRSALKRRALHAQDLGRRLTQLTTLPLDSVPISDALRQAIADYRRIAKKSARRRQLQFIGRLMRDEDQAAVEAAIAAIDHASAQQKYHHRGLENWRDRLLTEAEALTAYVSEHPGTDVKMLRDILAQHRRAKDPPAAKVAARKLYRFLGADAQP